MAVSSVRTLRQRTVPQRPFDEDIVSATDNDPIWTDAIGRGLKKAWDARLATGSPIGPLPDPRWAGFFQAMEDAGVDRIGGMSGLPTVGGDAVPARGARPRADATAAATGGAAGTGATTPAAPTPPPAPPAPPPPGGSASLGALAAQTGAMPGLVTRYTNSTPGGRVRIDPDNATAFPPDDAVRRLRSRILT